MQTFIVYTLGWTQNCFTSFRPFSNRWQHFNWILFITIRKKEFPKKKTITRRKVQSWEYCKSFGFFYILFCEFNFELNFLICMHGWKSKRIKVFELRKTNVKKLVSKIEHLGITPQFSWPPEKKVLFVNHFYVTN